VSRLFLSHSSANNAQSVALCDWLAAEGWDDVFLDLDADHGIAAGERWEQALIEAASRCEAVLFLISRAWLESRWCLKEFMLAHQLNKRLFGLLVEPLAVTDLPPDLSGNWQAVSLASGKDHRLFRVKLPQTHEECDVSFSREGLARLRAGLVKAGLDPRFFDWPPESDPNRAPYRGLLPLEADDAGIFFGRDAPIVEALDKLRGLREALPPRLFVILGASGAGKSSFLRAGLLPRMTRDEHNFVPLPIIRPERAAISGETGLLRALERALDAAEIPMARDDLRSAVDGGGPTLRPVLHALIDKTRPAVDRDAPSTPPALVISIDQGEELFMAEGREEAQPLLALLPALLTDDELRVIVVIAVRSDSYAHLQEAKLLDGARPELFDLGPMPRGSYAEVIKGPATRLEKSTRPLKIEDGLVDVLLGDIEAGGAKDALPLLSFTLERLYLENKPSGALTAADYQELGGIKGSIEEAVERALKMADADPDIPTDRAARLALLRRGIIPWLAGVDPDTRAPCRRVAQLAKIPAECRPLLEHLVEQRLLTTDVSTTSGVTIEPAHEALLRQWGLLQSWITEDEGLLAVLEGVKRAAQEWTESGANPSWLAHSSGRLDAAERVCERPDLAANLQLSELDYLEACRKAESSTRKRKRYTRIGIYAMLVGIIIGLIGWINQKTIEDQVNWVTRMWPYQRANYRPYQLSAAAEQALKPGDTFRECGKDCPEMIVVPPGEFIMGSAEFERGRANNEGPQHKVGIPDAFAVSVFDVTFEDWDACVAVAGCPSVPDSGFGRGRRPVTNVTWDDAKQYVKWLARMTGRPYRLLTEAEWEYAARAGTTTTYWWGDEVGTANANCIGCGSQWDNRETSPVGSFKPNAFGLYDVSGNAWQWVEDCWHANYNGAPTDGSAWLSGDCNLRTDRGGSWVTKGDQNMRIAFRGNYPAASRNFSLGFRVARTLPR
jgi:formylglycine-generating enzyme required for sulfatase activity